MALDDEVTAVIPEIADAWKNTLFNRLGPVKLFDEDLGIAPIDAVRPEGENLRRRVWMDELVNVALFLCPSTTNPEKFAAYGGDTNVHEFCLGVLVAALQPNLSPKTAVAAVAAADVPPPPKKKMAQLAHCWL